MTMLDVIKQAGLSKGGMTRFSCLWWSSYKNWGKNFRGSWKRATKDE